MKIELGINQFIKLGSQILDKNADYCGGYYNSEELPKGNLKVVTTATVDQIGCFRESGCGVLFQGSAQEIVEWNNTHNGW
jgi:hypothetical protein